MNGQNRDTHAPTDSEKRIPPEKSGRFVVVLTGGIGSGKSAAAALFATWGSAVVDADVLARRVVEPGTQGLDAIIRRFTTAILRADGTLDRRALGDLVFRDRTARADLERIVHPLIRAEWLRELSALPNNGSFPFVTYVVPLFFESGGAYPEVDRVVSIIAPRSERIARICSRDSVTEAEAGLRIAAQTGDDDRRRASHYVIENDADLPALEARARKVFDVLAGEAHGSAE